MRRIIAIYMFCAMFVVSLHAQNVVDNEENNSSWIDSSLIVKNYTTQLDSLVNLWYVKGAEPKQFSDFSKNHYDSSYVPQFTAKEYRSRIEKMNSVVKIEYNDKVQAYINVYANKRRNSVSTMLGMAEYYFPLFEDIFDEYDIPLELKYLSIIESALNPKAKSPAGARGIWQFMPTTGRRYDLKINSYLDERCDPIKSTHAAAAYLKDLYAIFNDWILAIAAYNCGPGNVKKAIARAGGKTDYWDIYYYLPRETRGYVPAYIAAYYVFEHHEDHNLFPRKISMPQVDTVIVSKKLHFNQIAEVLDIPLKEIEDLNPQYKVDMVPFDEAGSPLYLPVEIVTPFIRLEDSIYAYKDSLYLHIQPERTIAASSYSTADRTKTYYTVRKGDSFSKIASKYGVSVSTLKSWNHKTSNMLHIGDKLVIYSKSAGKGNSAPTATASVKNAPKTTNSSHVSMTNKTQNDDKYYHTVKSGDTLWSISQRYGTTVAHIQSINGMKNSKLSPGMQLRIQ